MKLAARLTPVPTKYAFGVVEHVGNGDGVGLRNYERRTQTKTGAKVVEKSLRSTQRGKRTMKEQEITFKLCGSTPSLCGFSMRRRRQRAKSDTKPTHGSIVTVADH
jgi:hypothetical protein